MVSGRRRLAGWSGSGDICFTYGSPFQKIFQAQKNARCLGTGMVLRENG
jgi:hypothetical protein